MSILLSRMCVVPTWFVVVGLVALSSPPIVPKGVLSSGCRDSRFGRHHHLRAAEGIERRRGVTSSECGTEGATIERRSVLTAMHRTSCGWTVTRDERTVGPTVWGDDRSPAVAGLRWRYRRCSRSRYPPSWARCRTHTPLKERLSQCCLRSMWIHGPRLSCAECWGSSSAQARDFGMSGGVPAAIQRRTRAASDVRKMVPFGIGNRSPGQASRGLGLRDGLRGRARGRSPML